MGGWGCCHIHAVEGGMSERDPHDALIRPSKHNLACSLPLSSGHKREPGARSGKMAVIRGCVLAQGGCSRFFEMVLLLGTGNPPPWSVAVQCS